MAPFSGQADVGAAGIALSLPTNFEFNSNTVRVVEIDGDPWFVGADACSILEIRNIRRTDVGMVGGRDMYIISESGLYKLIMRSDKPEARAFQDWVTGTVLPALRKDGGYIVGEEKVATGEMDSTKAHPRERVSR